MPIVGERATVLITVKTSPQPSAKYGDTVCVAGVRLDGLRLGEWIRLYPIPFRYLDSDHQFRKYDQVEVTVRRRHQDGRRESYSPEWESINVFGHLDSWRDRVEVMRNVPRTTTCQLQEGTRGNPNGPSLGMTEIADVSRLRFEDHPGWTPAEQVKIANALSQLDLFGDGSKPPQLKAPRFKAIYRYRCTALNCSGHDGQILDWELTELERRLRQESDQDAKRKITERFLGMMFSAKRSASFFLGNFENPTKRDKFSVLGVYYPSKIEESHATLF